MKQNRILPLNPIIIKMYFTFLVYVVFAFNSLYYVEAEERQKRQANDPENLTIEVLFVVDYAVYERFLGQHNGNDTEASAQLEIYYARVFEGLNKRYQGITSPEVKFTLTYSDLNISKTAELSIWTTLIKQVPEVGSSREMVDTATVLDLFLNWTNTTEGLPNFDYAFLFTGYNLTYGGSSSNTGLSYPSSICKPISQQEPMSGPVAVAEEQFDFRTVSIIAQELGRSLGARKDLDGNFCLPSFLYIMTPKFQFPDESRASNLWKFSSCSVDYFETYVASLNNNGDNCLTQTEATDYIKDVPLFLRSKSASILNIDHQCKTIYGQSSFLCRGIQGSDFGSICRGAYCFIPERQTCALILPGDGTLCENQSLCDEGICKFNETVATVPVDCPFGNQPVIPNSDGCEQRININNRTFDCYQPALRLVCCKTCGDLYTGIGGCEYGDRQPNCDYNSCGIYDNYTREVRCCRTCSVRPLISVLTSTVTLSSETSETSDLDVKVTQTSEVTFNQDYSTLPTVTISNTNQTQGTSTTGSNTGITSRKSDAPSTTSTVDRRTTLTTVDRVSTTVATLNTPPTIASTKTYSTLKTSLPATATMVTTPQLTKTSVHLTTKISTTVASTLCPTTRRSAWWFTNYRYPSWLTWISHSKSWYKKMKKLQQKTQKKEHWKNSVGISAYSGNTGQLDVKQLKKDAKAEKKRLQKLEKKLKKIQKKSGLNKKKGWLFGK